MSFTKQSRLRMLALIAKIDWQRCGRSSFLTLTYPDSDIPLSSVSAAKHLETFMRKFRRVSGMHGCLWRVELQRRKSGQFLGQVMPHFHLVAFGCHWVDRKRVTSIWQQSNLMVYPGFTQIQEMANPNQCGYYISKYLAKEVPCELVSITYSDGKTGRHWGLFDRKKVPMHPKGSICIPVGEVDKELRMAARDVWGGVPLDPLGGYQVFGPRAQSLCQELQSQLGLDDEDPF